MFIQIEIEWKLFVDCSSSEFRQSKNSVRFADENCSPEESMMRMMSAQDYYAQQIAMSSGGYNIYGNYPQARAGPGSGGYQYPIDQAEMFNRCQYMNIPSQSDSAGGCNGRYQYHHQPPVTLQHHHERKESGESSSCQHNPQDICSEACTAQSGDYTSQSCAEISKSSLNLCNDTSNNAGNDICNSLQDDCPDRSDKPSCQSRCSFPKMNSMHNSYSAQDYMESLGCTFCEQSASNMDPSSGSYPSEYCYGAPIPIEHCAQSSPMTYDTQQMARPCHSAPYCWPMQSGCAPTPTYCPMSCCAPSPVSCMPPCCCPQQSSCNCAKDSVDIQTIYGTDYRGICGNQFNHFPNTGSCGICSNCSACMGIVSGPNDDCPETCAPCKGSCIFTGTNGFCSMAHPTSSYHQMMSMSTGSSHQMTHGSSHDMSTGSSYQISPGSSYQISPGSSHQIVPIRSQQISPSMSQGSSHQMQLAMSPSSSHQMQLCMCPSSLQQAMAPTSSHQMQLGMPSFSTHEMSPMMSRMMSPMSSNCSFQMPPCQIRSCPGLPQIVPSMSPNLSPTHSFQMPCTSSTCAQNFANPLPGSASSGIPLPFSQSWSAQPYEMPEDGGYMPAQPFSNPTPKASSYDVRTVNRQCP